MIFQTCFNLFRVFMLVLLAILTIYFLFNDPWCSFGLMTGCVIALLIMMFVYSANGISLKDKLVADINREILHATVLDAYYQENDRIRELEEGIYEKYGIKVYCNLDVAKLYGYDDVKTMTAAGSYHLVRFLEKLDDALSMYSKTALLSIPKRMYLNSAVYHRGKPVGGINFGSTHIVFNACVCNESSIHHELFHSLEEQMPRKLRERFKSSSESCHLTSDYACTDMTEFLAEAWAKAMTDGETNEHARILSELKAKFLKDETVSGDDDSSFPDTLVSSLGSFLESFRGN